MTLSASPPSREETRAQIALRLGIALVLLVAAFMKAHQLATTPSLGEGLLHARWFNIAVIVFELFFGVWLIYGFHRKITWVASVLLFSLFASVSAFRFFSGEKSCGCFGTVEIPPLGTATFDAAVVALLFLFRPVSERNEQPSVSNLASFAFSWLVLSVPVVGVLLFSNFARVDASGAVVGHGRIVVLEPEQWIGKPCPILRHFVTSQNISQGKYRILLFRDQCEKCHAVLSDWRNLPPSEGWETVLINVSASAPPETLEIPNDWSTGELSRRYTWAVATPVILHVDGGVVQFVKKDF